MPQGNDYVARLPSAFANQRAEASPLQRRAAGSDHGDQVLQRESEMRGVNPKLTATPLGMGKYNSQLEFPKAQSECSGTDFTYQGFGDSEKIMHDDRLLLLSQGAASLDDSIMVKDHPELAGEDDESLERVKQ